MRNKKKDTTTRTIGNRTIESEFTTVQPGELATPAVNVVRDYMLIPGSYEVDDRCAPCISCEGACTGVEWVGTVLLVKLFSAFGSNEDARREAASDLLRATENGDVTCVDVIVASLLERNYLGTPRMAGGVEPPI